jgi:hypothetical protein
MENLLTGKPWAGKLFTDKVWGNHFHVPLFALFQHSQQKFWNSCINVPDGIMLSNPQILSDIHIGEAILYLNLM